MFDMNLIEKSQGVAKVIRPHHLGNFMAIHPRIVEKYQSAAKWPSVGRTLASPERCQACTSKKQQRNEGWADILNDLLSIIGRHVSLLLPSTAPRGLSLTLFLGTIRYICFSASDGLDFHLRIHHLHKDASICPPSWLGCIIACLPVFIADAKSLQMLHHFLFPMPVIFQSFFFFPFFFSFSLCVCIIIICPERALSEGGLFVLQPGSQLFSGSAVFFSSPSVQFEYPREIWLCLWYLFFVLLSFYFSSSVCSLPRYCHLFWRLIVSHVFFFLFCLAVQKISVDIIVLVKKKKKKNQDSFFVFSVFFLCLCLKYISDYCFHSCLEW